MSKESHIRSVLKAISWRVVATMSTVVISYFITGSIEFAVAIGSFEVFAKLFLFYLHERLWHKISIGKGALSSQDLQAP